MNVTILLLLLFLQDDPDRLVEALRADDPAERKRASQQLRDLGAMARPALEKAAGDADVDVSGQAKSLLRTLDLQEKLPPKFLKDHPGIADRLASGSDDLWAETFDAVLETADVAALDLLAPRTLHAKGFLGGSNRMMIAGDLGLASALPELLRIAQASDGGGRAAALTGLSMMASPSPQFYAFRLGRRGPQEPDEARIARIRRIGGTMVPELQRTLASDDSALRCRILFLLAFIQQGDSVPVLLSHLEDASADVRAAAVRGLIGLKAPELVPALAPILKKIPEHARIPVIEEIGKSGVRRHVGVLAEQFAEGSPAMAGHSLIALARLRSEEHLPEIRGRMESPDSNVRWFAVRAVGAWGDPKEAPALIRRLEDDDVEVRWAAIEALGAVDAKEAVPALEKLLQAPLKKTRTLAREAIDRIARPPPAPPARETLPAALLKAMPGLADPSTWVEGFVKTSNRDAHPGLRARDVEPLARAAVARARSPGEIADVCRAIAAWDLVELAPSIVPFLRDTDEARDAIFELEARSCAPLLLPLLEEPSAARDRAAWLLACLDPARTDARVAKHLDSPSASLCVLAVGANARLGRKEAIPKLLKLLDHEDEEIAWKAGDALSRLGAVDAVPRLVRFLGSSATLAMHLLPAVARLDRAEGRRQGERLLAHSNERIRETALRFLVDEGYRESAPEIAKLLGGDLRGWVAHSLARLDARDQIPELVKHLDASEQGQQVMQVLAEMDSKEGLAFARTLLQGTDEEARVSAAGALADLGDRESIPAIEALLASKDAFGRALAIQALANVRSTGSADRIRKLLSDPDEGVVDDAAVALADLVGDKALVEVFRKADADRRRSLLPALVRLGSAEPLRSLPEPRGRFIVDHAGSSLNAIRKPDAWRRLRDATLPRDLEGMPQEVLAAIARQAGLPLEGSVDSPRFVRVRSRNGLTSLLDALESATEGAFVLESDRIRILPGSDVRRFWKAWWTSQEAK
jgi:HEAT repeat protein